MIAPFGVVGGIRQHGVAAITHRFTGLFETDEALLERFMKLATV